jgi:glycosyltransferase involved in cell wall biosynthesis
MKLSVIILTYNSNECIERCLSSVKWADEIIVIDSFSKDNTLELVSKFDVKFEQKEYLGYSRQLEYGINKTSNEWILVLDHDEELSPELISEIQNLDANSLTNFSGFEINRQVYFLGKWISHGGWYPDFQFRLFKKNKIKFNHLEVHGSVRPDGAVRKLQNKIYHYTYSNLFAYLERINSYTSLHVSERVDKNKKFKWYKLILNPLSTFLRMYFGNKGYKDKMQGFILALYSAIYNLVLYSKLWEYQYSAANKLELPPITVSDFQKHKSRA